MKTEYYLMDFSSVRGQKYILAKHILSQHIAPIYECFSTYSHEWGIKSLDENSIREYGTLISKEEANKRILIQKLGN